MSRTIGFIPLRKNSKGIPGKNKRKLLGRPLFSWVLTEALFSGLDHVYVFTDDEWIIEYVARNYQWSTRLSCVRRSPENAGDTSSTEAAILEFCSGREKDFDAFFLLQATSPLTRREHIDEALQLLASGGTDSVLSVVNTHRFVWSAAGKALNYDISRRPRRQDFDGLLIENGAIYGSTKQALLASGNRLSGKIATIRMPEETLTELDSETDWILLEQLLISRLKSGKSAGPIRYLLLDVDGVLTDGRIVYGAEGELSKTFDMRDGMGLEILREQGVQVMVLTSENSEVVRQRMKKLKIEDTFLGVKDKYAFLEHLCSERGIKAAELAYVGDDVNDLANMLRAGWSFCPANATRQVKYLADAVLSRNAADGAIRELTEFILNYNLRFNGI